MACYIRFETFRGLITASAAAALVILAACPTSAGEITGFSWSSGVASVALTTINPPTSPNNDDTAGTSPNEIFITQKDYTGIGPVDLVFDVRDSSGTTEYFFREGVQNSTGLDWSSYRLELGYGIDSGFVASDSSDALDFDWPDVNSDFFFNPSPGFFPSIVVGEDEVTASGGIHPNGAFAGYYIFHVDVPDGITEFTIRQTPIAVPEPTTAVLMALGLLSLGLGLHARGSGETPPPRT